MKSKKLTIKELPEWLFKCYWIKDIKTREHFTIEGLKSELIEILAEYQIIKKDLVNLKRLYQEVYVLSQKDNGKTSLNKTELEFINSLPDKLESYKSNNALKGIQNNKPEFDQIFSIYKSILELDIIADDLNDLTQAQSLCDKLKGNITVQS